MNEVANELAKKTAGLYTTICVAHEFHKDGGDHLHAYLKFGRKKKFCDPLEFDVKTFHPHISNLKTPPAWWCYIRKDGDYVILGN